MKKRVNDKVKIDKPEWVWVDGYKGTDSKMRCRDNYQFILGEIHDMPEDAEIEACKSGFHFCKELSDVFLYYSIGNGNRFFKVRALVRAADLEEVSDKLVAKSILLVSEVSVEEIFDAYPCPDDIKNWSLEDKEIALHSSMSKVHHRHRVTDLIDVGYSAPFAEFLLDIDMYTMAYALGTQKDLSMDIKVSFIMDALKERRVDRHMRYPRFDFR